MKLFKENIIKYHLINKAFYNKLYEISPIKQSEISHDKTKFRRDIEPRRSLNNSYCCGCRERIAVHSFISSAQKIDVSYSFDGSVISLYAIYIIVNLPLPSTVSWNTIDISHPHMKGLVRLCFLYHKD